MLNFPVERGLLLFNPVLGMKKPAEPKRREVHVSDADYARLKGEVLPWIGRYIRFTGETGLRMGEVRRLRPEHLDLAGGYVHVPEGGKTGTRPVPLTADARAVVEELREERRKRLRELGRIEPGADYLFTDVNGAPLTRETEGQIARAVKRALRRMGIDVPPRQGGLRLLRHTYASRLVQRGVGLAHVQDLLGHADPKMTRRYAHLAPADLKAAVAVLDVAPSVTSGDTHGAQEATAFAN